MRYLPKSPAEREEMLAVTGSKSMEQLFESVARHDPWLELHVSHRRASIGGRATDGRAFSTLFMSAQRPQQFEGIEQAVEVDLAGRPGRRARSGRARDECRYRHLAGGIEKIIRK